MKHISCLQNQDIRINISYTTWLRLVFNKRGVKELSEIGRDLLQSQPEGNRIITPKPINNQYYQSLQGV